MSTNPPKQSFQVYSKSTFMIAFSEITGLHYEHESFATNEEAEQWIMDQGKKQKEYTIMKMYKQAD